MIDKRRERFRQQGLCPRCSGKQPLSTGSRSCDTCRFKATNARRILMANKNHLVKSNLLQRERREKLRKEVILLYGGKCTCCNETNDIFLAIDHIDGGGTQHMKEINSSRFYPWLKANFQPDKFQVLCHNCNWGKHKSGICPHQK